MITGKAIHDFYDISYSDSTTFGIYAGFQEIDSVRSKIKIGRCNNAAAIQRGRSQGGANWWFVSFYPMPSNASTYIASKAIKEALSIYRIPGEQGQTEIYNITETKLDALILPLLDELGYSSTNIIDKII